MSDESEEEPEPAEADTDGSQDSSGGDAQDEPAGSGSEDEEEGVEYGLDDEEYGTDEGDEEADTAAHDDGEEAEAAEDEGEADAHDDGEEAEAAEDEGEADAHDDGEDVEAADDEGETVEADAQGETGPASMGTDADEEAGAAGGASGVDAGTETTAGTIQEERTAFCHNCGEEISADADICPECGVRQTSDDSSDAGTGGGTGEDVDPVLAGAASLLIPGAGSLLIGQTERGAIWLGALLVALVLDGVIATVSSFLTVIFIGFLGFLLIPLIHVILHPVAAYDAYNQAKQLQE